MEQSTEQKENKKNQQDNSSSARLIRILQTDIPASKNIYTGLTKIKGVSWGISNAVCILMNLDKTKKVGDFEKKELEAIEEFLKKGEFPEFLLNRKNDFTTGESKHLLGSDLDLVKEFDIKRLKGIRSYRGWRHATGRPARGQKTRSNFRKNRKKGVGVKKKIKQ
jgi:small subunit ribosomal protein S13